MGKMIIEEKFIDSNFINFHVNGFEEYKKYINSLDIKELSYISGIVVEDIIRS